MKKLYYVRHGETEMNVANIWSGQIETPLTEHGQQQARITGKRIKENYPAIDVIICSTLSRTKHTAQLIAQEINYPVDKIMSNELFIERGFGVLEGKAGYTRDISFEELDRIEGSETIAEVHDRAIRAFQFLQSLPQNNILVVSHGTFGRALRRVVEQLPYTHEYDKAHRDNYRLKNAEIVELL